MALKKAATAAKTSKAVAKAPAKAAPKAAAKAPATARTAKKVAPATATAAKTSSPTVTLRHLSASIAETYEMPKKQAEAVLTNVIDLMVKHLKKGDRVRIGGLGILQVKKRAARMGRNPATGEAIKIKASKKVAFRAAKELKESI